MRISLVIYSCEYKVDFHTSRKYRKFRSRIVQLENQLCRQKEHDSLACAD